MFSSTMSRFFLSIVIVVVLVGTAFDAHGQVFYQWTLTNVTGNTPGPVTGTIGFSSLVPGAGGTHAPSSFTIESAPGHNINNGYVLGEEIVGSGLWQDISQSGSFEFNTSDVAVSGDFAFREPVLGLLLMDYRSPSQNSFFRSQNSPNNTTQGPATWTLVVPEPSGLLLGISAFFLAVPRTRRETPMGR